MDPIEFNKQLDSRLSNDGKVDQDLFNQFLDAQDYGAASTIGWIEAKLGILLNRLAQGNAIHLYEPGQADLVECNTVQSFRLWVNTHLKGASI